MAHIRVRPRGWMWMIPLACMLVGSGFALGRRYNDLVILLGTVGTRSQVFADVTGRVEVSCSQIAAGDTMIALLIGQSNAANHGEAPLMRAPEGLFNYFGGRCYEASDPLLGGTGEGASVWTRLGRRIVARHLCDRVVLATLAVSGARVEDWAPGGKLNRSLVDTLADLDRTGLQVTQVLWQQGEADALVQTSRSDYERRLRAVMGTIRNRARSTPIYVSLASRCGSIGPDPEVRAAQAAVVDAKANVFAGPDIDALDGRYRYDGCHFTEDGLEQLANLWLERLAPQWDKPLD